MRAAVAVVLSALLVTACSGSGGAEVPPSPSPSASPTPSVTPSPAPEVEFALEVEELWALVEESVRGSGDLAASSRVLTAFATTVALIRVEEEQELDRQRVVDAAEAAAEAYLSASRTTLAVERASTVAFAESRLQQLEDVIDALPR